MDPRHIPIRSFTVYQTSEGWFWNWLGINRAVGPFPTAYKADYSRLSEQQLAEEDYECEELLKHSRPVSR